MRMNVKWFMALLVGAVMFSCSDDALIESPEALQEETTSVATLIAGLSEDEGNSSRLAYELQSDGRIKMTWADGDKLAANALIGNQYYTYEFSLISGVGTNQGTFTSNSSTVTGNSYNWTIYYPGSKIQNENGWYGVSYLNQKQTGDKNINHLKDFHSVRLPVGNVDFNDTYIDFSGDNVDESMCMKFNLESFPSSTPTKIELMYMNAQGNYESCFHVYNYLDDADYVWGYRNGETVSRMTLNLDGFSQTTSLTAYMMMSNYPVEVKNGGKFRVYLTTTDKKYYCDVAINKDVTLKGGLLHSITCKTWNEASTIDGFDNPTEGVVVLQEATKGSKGADIIIMGDGYDKDQFAANGSYVTAMENAYEDFFSVEPYKSLKEYFNVYYINAVSEDNHDATPQDNGAINGVANTIFGTKFVSGSTTITGNGDVVLEYAKQAIRAKGGKGKTAVTDEAEVYSRVNTALMMVMVNVQAHAGTCVKVWTTGTDYGNAYSIAYTALGTTSTGEYGRKWTTIHEAGGHGFGKLADEYAGKNWGSVTTQIWYDLDEKHSYGVDRNVDKFVSESNANTTWSATTEANVYWSPLMESYKEKEGLGIFEGANTYNSLYCRPTENSVMRDQFAENGQFFNAISRWAIWYRLMRLTGDSYNDFKSSLNDFITFDSGLTIEKNVGTAARSVLAPQDYKPLPPPVMIKGEWINGRLITE